MSRSSRADSNDIGLRRSKRQRRQLYETLDQTILLDRHFNEILFADDSAARRVRSLRSANVPERGSSSGQAAREMKRRSSSEHAPSREVMALRSCGGGGDPGDSDTEEILDIYSRVKRRRRCSQRAYIVEELHPDDSNPSIVTEADSDLVPNHKRDKQKPLVNALDPESSDSELVEEDRIRQRYFLRPTKPAIKRFESTLPEPKRRRLELVGRSSDHEDDSLETHGPRKSAFQSPAHRRTTRKRFLLSKKPSDSSSESDASDGDVKFERKQAKKLERNRAKFLPFNLNDKDVQRSLSKNVSRPRHGASCADVDPMHIDNSIGFNSIGGLTQHIFSLKEMILFPLMYPEVFAKFKINPPRGVLFYGPPGTGKTLVARALANECSKHDRKVAFFMRKGADCLSKWVGESERQLRLLFDQAYSMRPSIIFFDEIDGLAPVRSSRQDQIHSSIVSTLLALMDGLDDRSEVIVIGATNRIDAIDPALRRPGRFDRELRFSMPDMEARKEILRIHTKDWQPPLDNDLLAQLAARTVGYGGADLKGLCAEGAFIALRRSYPQIYAREERLALDPSAIQVSEGDFIQAMEKQLPSSERSLTAPVRAIAKFMEPLIGTTLQSVIALIPGEFIKKVDVERRDICDVQSVLSSLSKRPPVLGRHILLCGQSADCGQTKYFAPAILHKLDHLPTFSLAIPNLYSSGNRTPEEFIAETLTMASRSGPCVVFLPAIDSWDNVVSTTAWATLKTCLGNWTARTPVLVLATANCSASELNDEVRTLFAADGVLQVPSSYSDAQRRAFFEPLLLTEAQCAPEKENTGIYAELPLAPPPPPRKFTESELKELRRQEESVLRELRIFLREIALRLFRDRKFSIFAKPVDLNQAPDYYEIVHQPMDLSKIMSKIDQHKYECVAEFLSDIELITQNALEYNPDNDQTDKVIRHRACDLRDVAYALIDSELDWSFEEKCQEIMKARRERGEHGPAEPPPPYVFTAKTRANLAGATDQNEPGSSNANPVANEDQRYQLRKNNTYDVAAAAIVKKYRASQRRMVNLKQRTGARSVRKRGNRTFNAKLASREDEQPAIGETHCGNDVDTSLYEAASEINTVTKVDEGEPIELPEPPKVEISVVELHVLLHDLVDLSKTYSLVNLERTFVEIEAIVARYAGLWDRKGLVSGIRRTLHMQ